MRLLESHIKCTVRLQQLPLPAPPLSSRSWYRAGIMNAMQPWSGNYGASVNGGGFTAGPMVWTTAHTTQFSQPGWTYLKTGSGSLHSGGSYVTLRDYSGKDFSIVVEKFSRDRSSCVRPGLPAYATAAEVATFTLAGSLASTTSLHLWYTHFAYLPGDVTSEFVYQGTVPVVGGTFTLNVTVDSLYTLTTLATGNKGSFPVPPKAVNFPAVWKDNFDSCPLSSEAALFADQNGAPRARSGRAACTTSHSITPHTCRGRSLSHAPT